MTIDHGSEAARDHVVTVSMDYRLSAPDAVIGASPDERCEEIRRQLLAGPLDAIGDGDANDTSQERNDPQVHLHMEGNHHFNPATGEVSGQLLGVDSGRVQKTPLRVLQRV